MSTKNGSKGKAEIIPMDGAKNETAEPKEKKILDGESALLARIALLQQQVSMTTRAKIKIEDELRKRVAELENQNDQLRNQLWQQERVVEFAQRGIDLKSQRIVGTDVGFVLEDVPPPPSGE